MVAYCERREREIDIGPIEKVSPNGLITNAYDDHLSSAKAEKKQ